MECKYFSRCGSCKIFDLGYEGQLKLKIDENKRLFEELGAKKFEVVSSPDSNFRARAEFRIYHSSSKIFYAMHSLEGKGLVVIDECPMTSKPIFELMPKLIKELESMLILKERLFAIEFLSSLNEEILVTLIYHKKLDEEWAKEAQKVQKLFDISIIGRSRGQKVVLKKDFITEELRVFDKSYRFIQKEGSFTQPNPYINQKMIEWTKEASKGFGKDLLELYCGAGNFTIPLSENFNKVLATEISKTSIKAALKNCELNGTNNVKFVRLSSEEFVEAYEEKRSFSRLKNAQIDLKEYDFSTIFVDPPRAGLDETTRTLSKKFENIIYISCNPKTMYRDLQEIIKTHKIEKFAFFDQFPYTNHLECGAILKMSKKKY
ncbi:tRNA (uridine(54)-C5)-methyltransferase TrmA [Nitrosophilus labii]|uniref:tRNA (uridine(54)-C5)-methyltransferase TrmA n=1 Tax=Nitrosophilus labii TaxID=2706014 RepID=UPI001656DB65|nr:tRNA (uridine(54)-C5)-methyltransferase TrmA [Nitrosophilus labii]